MTAFALILAGYSLFSALTLALTHFRAEHYPDQPLARAMGLLLLLALAGLQFAHFAWLYLDQPWVDSLSYRMALFTVAPTFYLFSQPLLQAPARPHSALLQLGHLVPLLAAPWLPDDLALPGAFIVGAGYMAWLGRSLFALRRERSRFRLEMMLLGSVFIIALGVSALGLMQAALPEKLFFSLYASAIGLAFFLVQTTLGLRPQLSTDVVESVQEAYVASTLNHIDCPARLAELDALMVGERLYTNPELSLNGLAQQLGLSAHQLSELLNARLGKSYSRYLREQRIAAAKAMLRDEPTASVLSIGLAVGFTAQSNFYDAFREIEGTTPGQYRKLLARNGAAE